MVTIKELEHRLEEVKKDIFLAGCIASDIKMLKNLAESFWLDRKNFNLKIRKKIVNKIYGYDYMGGKE